MKAFQKFDPPPVLEALQFVWPDDKPVKKGDTFYGLPVYLDEQGSYVILPSLYSSIDNLRQRLRNTDWLVVPSLDELNYRPIPNAQRYTDAEFTKNFEPAK